VRNEFLETHTSTLKTILEIINRTTIDFKEIPSIDKTIANRYKQDIQDVREWLNITDWSQNQINQKTVNVIQDKLLKLNIIDNKLKYNELTQQIF
ncbi:MAG: ABC transporter substrate-binding protein, partial [Mangrovimonas sp.]|nr:ABC transporter substrate-binding protein [Mangrovimonas sp.]